MDKLSAVDSLVDQGISIERAREIVGLERAREERARHKAKYGWLTHIDPWRCPTCKKLIELEECLYCRDRNMIKIERKTEDVKKFLDECGPVE